MALGKRRGRRQMDVWPGYVDALSSLLLLVIFVLMIFTFSQFLLSQLLSSKESELEQLHQRIEQLAEQLGLEQRKSADLARNVSQLSGMMSSLTEEKFNLTGQVDELQRQRQQDKATIERQLLMMASLQEDIDALRKVRDELEQRVGVLAGSLQMREIELSQARDRSKALQASLADQSERTRLAQAEVEKRDIRIQALVALVGEREKSLQEQQSLTADARAELARLNRQLDGLREQLQSISDALALAEKQKTEQARQIADLGKRLNLALARKVNRLEQYRSEFFGRLRQLLGNNPAVRIVGDRFLFQSELLFDSASAELGQAGRAELAKLANTLQDVAARIPRDIDWILRVDGHTDRRPIHTKAFPSNWELSSARAVAVVRYLASQGVEQRRMTAAGFGEFHPIDPGDSEAALARNRRIEIKLTSR